MNRVACLLLPLIFIMEIGLGGNLSFRVGEVILEAPRTGHQFVVTDSAGQFPRDVTHESAFQCTPPGVVNVDQHGYLTPLGDGIATVSATVNGSRASARVLVSGQSEESVINFTNDVVPIFTKFGCNGGSCHGKSGGQNSFRLSLFGYEPWNDHEWLALESRGRRLSPAAPENSLLLAKATGEIPHEGGIRFAKGDPNYRMIADWIRQGMTHSPESTPEVEKIEVFPTERVAPLGSRQQLAVRAYFSDGTSRDITRKAIFEANQDDMAEADEKGLVTLKDKTGSTSVMVRFQEHVAVFRATIPLGETLEEVPQPVNLIDREIFSKLSLLGLPPSGPCDDTSFLRRVTVDIAGRLPTPSETTEFIDSKDPAKRSAKIDQLLDSPDYAAYFAQKWTAILRNKRTRDTYQRGTYAFHNWVKSSLRRNTPFDEFVTAILTANGEIGRNPPVGWYRAVRDQKEQMQDIAQIFLGIRMQCAQCHHHPYEKWSQDDYYGFAAFLSTIGRKKGEQPDEEIIFHRRTPPAMQNPNTRQNLKPTPLGEKPVDLDGSVDPRTVMADWLTSPDNPYFARMLVNRYWKHFFSTALVEPEDDMRVTNPASHPALLDGLASEFAESGFDLKHLIRTICNSRTYQLESEPNEFNVTDTQNYSRYYPKRLQAEVLLDAINVICDSEDRFSNQPSGVRATWLPDDRFNQDSYFLTVFGRPEMDSACECERVADANLAQSLHLINSKSIQEKISSDNGRAARLARETNRSDDERITEFYQFALSRGPNESELAAAKGHLSKKRRQAAEKDDDELTPERAEREAFEDLLWAVMNTKEFLFNH